jgi:H+-transporting ATPase
MAEPNSTTAPAVNTPIESGKFDEKEARPADVAAPNTSLKPKVEDEEEEDEDMDALIEDLESQDGHDDAEEEEVCRSRQLTFS